MSATIVSTETPSPKGQQTHEWYAANLTQHALCPSAEIAPEFAKEPSLERARHLLATHPLIKSCMENSPDAASFAEKFTDSVVSADAQLSANSIKLDPSVLKFFYLSVATRLFVELTEESPAAVALSDAHANKDRQALREQVGADLPTTEGIKTFLGISENTPGGVVVVMISGRSAAEAAFGSISLSKEHPITTSTPFNLASITKQFVAYAALVLVERNQMQLSDPAIQHLPDSVTSIPGIRSLLQGVSVEDLIRHRSGVRNYFDAEVGVGDSEPLNNIEVLERLGKHGEREFEPGANHSYSNSGYILLAAMIEHTAQTTFQAFVKKELFEPMEMSGTFVADEAAYKGGRLPQGFSAEDGSFTMHPGGTHTYGDGGLISNLRDMEKWQKMVEGHGPQLISEVHRTLMFSPDVLADGTRTPRGLGAYIPLEGHRTNQNEGSDAGHESIKVHLPRDDCSIILIFNWGVTDFQKYAVMRQLIERYVGSEAARTAQL